MNKQCKQIIKSYIKVLHKSLQNFGHQFLCDSTVITSTAIMCIFHCKFPSTENHNYSLASQNYTALWQRHMCVNNLPRIVT